MCRLRPICQIVRSHFTIQYLTIESHPSKLYACLSSAATHRAILLLLQNCYILEFLCDYLGLPGQAGDQFPKQSAPYSESYQLIRNMILFYQQFVSWALTQDSVCLGKMAMGGGAQVKTQNGTRRLRNVRNLQD